MALGIKPDAAPKNGSILLLVSYRKHRVILRRCCFSAAKVVVLC